MPGILLDMTGHQKQFRNATALAAIVNIVLNLWLVPRFGATGAAVATALSCILSKAYASLSVWRVLQLNTTIIQRLPWLTPRDSQNL